MSKEKVSVKGLVSLDDAIASLETILDGLKTGSLLLDSENGALELRPHGDVKLKVKAKRKPAKKGKPASEELEVELSWLLPEEDSLPMARSGEGLPAQSEGDHLPAAKSEGAVLVVDGKGERKEKDAAEGAAENSSKEEPSDPIAMGSSEDLTVDAGAAAEKSTPEAAWKTTEQTSGHGDDAAAETTVDETQSASSSGADSSSEKVKSAAAQATEQAGEQKDDVGESASEETPKASASAGTGVKEATGKAAPKAAGTSKPATKKTPATKKAPAKKGSGGKVATKKKAAPKKTASTKAPKKKTSKTPATKTTS